MLNDEKNTSGLFRDDRRVIIFSESELNWSDHFSKENLTKVTVVSTATNFFSAPFTGCEAWSVVIIIDNLPHSIHDSRTFPVINLAITRAQYEVCIFAHTRVFERVQSFIRDFSSDSDDIFLDAANQVDVDLSFLGSYQCWDKRSHEIVQKLFQLSVQTSNVNLFSKLVDLYPGEDKKKSLPTLKILAALDEYKKDDFMEVLCKRVGHHIRKWIWRAIVVDSWTKIPVLNKLMKFPRASG